MKRNAILLCDLIVSLIVVEWSRLGPWDRLLGYNFYHSRGDVWLPTPPVAADFFRDMVSTGSWLFATFFLVTSVLIFCLGRPRGASPDEKRGILYQAFYGDTRRLVVKYAVFLFISFISPFFHNFMWRFPVTRASRIAGGLAISMGAFIIVLLIAELAARLLPRRPVPSL